MTALRRGLPEAEFRAVELWLGCFFPYQLRWILDWSRFAALLKARQIGASHTYAAACILWGILGEVTTVVSIGEREGLEVLDKAEKHAKVLVRLGSRFALPGGRTYRKDTAVRLASGGRIVALPASSGGRSFSGNVILDEFAYHGNTADTVWDGAAAVVMHGYKLRVISTPNGVGNLFHKLWTDPVVHRGYTLHRVTIDEAKAEGLRVDDAECWSMARGDAQVYDQLFRCEFLVSGNAFFSPAITRALWDNAEKPAKREAIHEKGSGSAKVGELRVYHAPDPSRSYVVSGDTSEGSGGDASALHVYERVTGRLMAVLDGQLKPWELAHQAALIGRHYRLALIAIERNNHGHTALRALQTEHGYPNVFHDRDGKPGWLTSAATRAPALDTLEQAHRAGHWAPRDPNVLTQVMSFVVTANGRCEAAPGTHDDHVMCAAIGWDVICRPATARNLRNLPPA